MYSIHYFKYTIYIMLSNMIYMGQRILGDRQLDEVCEWVDSLIMNRQKKNINRDFSDGSLMAIIVSKYFPKLIDLHNYPQANSTKSKLVNWRTLNHKVLPKIGINLSEDQCLALASSAPTAIQTLLWELKLIISNKEMAQEENRRFNESQPTTQYQKKDIQAKKISKIEELRQVLALLKDKISLVERSVERKDTQIRELQQIIKLHTP